MENEQIKLEIEKIRKDMRSLSKFAYSSSQINSLKKMNEKLGKLKGMLNQ